MYEADSLVVVLALFQVYKVVPLQMLGNVFVQTLVMLSLLSDVPLVVDSGEILELFWTSRPLQ